MTTSTHQLDLLDNALDSLAEALAKFEEGDAGELKAYKFAVLHLVLEIDGVRHADLAAHRLSTRQCFDMGARAEPKIAVYPSAANGYYVMIRPLPPGKHTLNFGGRCRACCRRSPTP